MNWWKNELIKLLTERNEKRNMSHIMETFLEKHFIFIVTFIYVHFKKGLVAFAWIIILTKLK